MPRRSAQFCSTTQRKISHFDILSSDISNSFMNLNTQYGYYLTIVFTAKMESVSKITIFGRKMIVKSALEKILLKFLGKLFSLILA